MAEFRVFLSAVTSESGLARDALANDLQARDVQVRVQRSFCQEPGADTLLQLLHDYIRGCDAVVCVIGKRSGACPPPDAAARFAHLLPPSITEASYTQWEFFFARAHKRRLSLYLAEPDYPGPGPALRCRLPGTASRLHPAHQDRGTTPRPVRQPRSAARQGAEGALAGEAEGQVRSCCPIRASAASSRAATRSCTGCAAV